MHADPNLTKLLLYQTTDIRKLNTLSILRDSILDLFSQPSYSCAMSDRPIRNRSPIRPADCNLAASFEMVGDRWSLLILRSAFFGVRRFDDFCADLEIPRTVLSARLKRLVEVGIMAQQDYIVPGKRKRTEYVLTSMGEELRLPLLAMVGWADAWLAETLPPPLMVKRKSTGSPVSVGFLDAQGQPVTDDDISFAFADWALERAAQSGE
jgi:DNA-binding HxlR family transcriptional regulator